MFILIFSSKIKTLEQEKIYTELLQETLNGNSDTLPLLAEGFRESKRHIKVRKILLLNLYIFNEYVIARNARTEFS